MMSMMLPLMLLLVWVPVLPVSGQEDERTRLAFVEDLVDLGLLPPACHFPPFPTINRCQCSDFMWQRRSGVISGQCRSVDPRDGLSFCYLHQPTRCRDAERSLAFTNMAVSKIACGCELDSFGFCMEDSPFLFRRPRSTATAEDEEEEAPY